MTALTQQRAMEMLAYDNGVLRWKKKASKNTIIGEAAGCLNKGYFLVRVDGSLYGAHRIVWLLFHGELPALDIDHINGNPGDNRIENLRTATRAENMQNRKRAQRNNACGLLGVNFCKQRRKWKAAIAVNKVTRNLGYYNSPQEAHAAYLRGKVKFHPFQTLVP